MSDYTHATPEDRDNMITRVPFLFRQNVWRVLMWVLLVGLASVGCVVVVIIATVTRWKLLF